MTKPSFATVTEQVAETLGDGIRQRRWADAMPGRVALARELGVNHKTGENALKILTKAGWLERQDFGKGRRTTGREPSSPTALRIKILLCDKSDRNRPELLSLRHRLQETKHFASFTRPILQELSMYITRRVNND